MKLHKITACVATAAMLALSSCIGDLDRQPNDPNNITPGDLNDNARENLAAIMAKCYSSLAVSGQNGPDDKADIEGLDGGTSQWTRATFMLNEFTTDECLWIWADVGVFDLVTGTWSSSNANIFGAYSRYYTHIAVCNEFIRTARDPEALGIKVDDALRAELDQFILEARALRALSYFNIIDFFGRAVVAWDDQANGDVPPQAESRAALFNKVVADLEDVVAKWPDAVNGAGVVYGRIGKDAVQALLCRYYLNAEVFAGTPMYDKAAATAQDIISRHRGGGFQGTGLAKDYLALFCGNNDMFMPGGALADQNEILWGIPYHTEYTQPYGGTMFLIAGPVANIGKPEEPKKGFMTCDYYGTNQNWKCMHARKEFSDKFNFIDGVCADARTYLWATENAGFKKENTQFSEFTDGYAPIKFTNCMANSDGTLPRWNDPVSGLPRVGVQPVASTAKFPDTDLPLIRLADVYLMYAEAALRGGGDKSLGLQYVNFVRARAGVPAWTTAEYTLDNILDERARELYWENVRRTDLVRFNKFIDGYTWSWKNNSPAGTSLFPYMNVFPIPADVIATYGKSNYQQNEGY